MKLIHARVSLSPEILSLLGGRGQKMLTVQTDDTDDEMQAGFVLSWQLLYTVGASQETTAHVEST